jgi:ribonuclease Z
MMPLPYRWLTSLMVRYNGMSILIDAGEGTQIAMKKKGWSPKPIDVILFTHYHADHISGLPGLLLSMGNSERTEPLLLVGPKGLQRVVESLRVIAPELPFEIVYRELTEPEETIAFPGNDRFRIEAFRVHHNVVCYGYSIILDRIGRFDVDKALKLDIPKQCWNLLQKGENVTLDTADGGSRVLTPDMVLGAPRRGLKVTYTTDTRPCDAIVKNAAGADLFICEGMYGEDDKQDKALEHKHMTFAEAASLAAEARVGKLWLTHYSPSLVRPDDFMPAVRAVFPEAYPGKDGKSVDLSFENDD